MKKRAKLRVEGRVQGVFFRKSIKEKAVPLKLTGWVKNVEERILEGLLEGEEKNILKVAEYCRKGPQGARVQKVKLLWEKHKGEFKDFSIM